MTLTLCVCVTNIDIDPVLTCGGVEAKFHQQEHFKNGLIGTN